VAELERRLVETGVYDTVGVTLAPADQTNAAGNRPVVVTLTDRPRRILEAGATFSTAEGSGVDLRWTWHNRFKRADTLVWEARAANVDSRLGVDLSLPHWRNPGLTLRLSAAVVNENTDAYDRTALTVSADLQQRLGKTSWFSYGLGVDIGHYNENRFDPLTLLPINFNRDLAILTGRSSFYLDNSDDPLDPTTGWRLTVSAQPTVVGGEESVVFLRAESQATAYMPLRGNTKTILAGRVRLGSIVGGAELTVPSDRLFYAGGGGSVRGYEYQGVGPRLPDNTPRGGLSLFETSLEVRRDVWRNFQAVAFVDAGAVGFQETPNFSNLRYGAGLGVRYKLPFGPIRADVAFPLSAREGDAISRSTSASARRFDRDPAPRTAQGPSPDTPAKKARRKRTRLQALAFFGGMALAVLAALLLVLLVGGRMYLLSDSGPRPGHQLRRGQEDRPLRPDQCRGVKGDLFDDFTIDRVTDHRRQGRLAGGAGRPCRLGLAAAGHPPLPRDRDRG
jgi:translocation and assembly module TamA